MLKGIEDNISSEISPITIQLNEKRNSDKKEYILSPRVQSVSSLLYEQIRQNDDEGFRDSLSKLNLNSIGKVNIHRNDRKLIHWLAYYNRINFLEYYLNVLEANNISLINQLNVRDNHGRTALHIASKQGYINIVKYLLLKGAHSNLKDDLKSETPHQLAKRYHHDEISEIFEVNLSDLNESSSKKEAIPQSQLVALYTDNNKLILKRINEEGFCWLFPLNECNDIPFASFIQTLPITEKNWDIYLNIQKTIFQAQNAVNVKLVNILEETFINEVLKKINYKISESISFNEAIDIYFSFEKSSFNLDFSVDENSIHIQIINLFNTLKLNGSDKLCVFEYINEFSLGLISKYTLSDIISEITNLYPHFNSCEKILLINLIRSLLVADTNNSSINDYHIRKAFDQLVEQISFDDARFNFIAAKLTELFSISRQFCLPHHCPKICENHEINDTEDFIDPLLVKNRKMPSLKRFSHKRNLNELMIKGLGENFFHLSLAHFINLSIYDFNESHTIEQTADNQIESRKNISEIYNQISLKVVHDIVSKQELADRVNIIHININLAYYLAYEAPILDFYSSAAILGAFNNIAVSRLKVTLKESLKKKEILKKFNLLNILFSPENNYKAYRDIVNKLDVYIPYFPVIFKDVFFCNESNTNDLSKIELMGKIFTLINRLKTALLHQTDSFNYPISLYRKLKKFKETQPEDLSDQIIESDFITEQTCYLASILIEEEIIKLDSSQELTHLLKNLEYRLRNQLNLKIEWNKILYSGPEALSHIIYFLKTFDANAECQMMKANINSIQFRINKLKIALNIEDERQVLIGSNKFSPLLHPQISEMRQLMSQLNQYQAELDNHPQRINDLKELIVEIGVDIINNFGEYKLDVNHYVGVVFQSMNDDSLSSFTQPHLRSQKPSNPKRRAKRLSIMHSASNLFKSQSDDCVHDLEYSMRKTKLEEAPRIKKERAKKPLKFSTYSLNSKKSKSFPIEDIDDCIPCTRSRRPSKI